MSRQASVTASSGDSREPLFQYVLRLADTNLVLGQRLGEMIGHAPALEEELGFANLALDLMGQARLLLTYAGEVEGCGRDEDALAFFRDQGEYRNAVLVEQPNGDFAHTVVRQVLIDAWQRVVYEHLSQCGDRRLADIAAKAIKETDYHFRYSANWLVRLGDGTQESHERAQSALDALWMYTHELFAADDLDRQMAAAGVAPDLAHVRERWNLDVNPVLQAATLRRPADVIFSWHGKRGEHSEHLGRMLTELQYMQRTYPGAKW